MQIYRKTLLKLSWVPSKCVDIHSCRIHRASHFTYAHHKVSHNARPINTKALRDRDNKSTIQNIHRHCQKTTTKKKQKEKKRMAK